MAQKKDTIPEKCETSPGERRQMRANAQEPTRETDRTEAEKRYTADVTKR